MQMLYNSDSFAVVQFDPPMPATDVAPTAGPGRGGFEIVDKLARKEIYIQGALAERFKQGVQDLVQQQHTPAQLDEFISGFTGLALYPVILH
jgi:Protein of unknown function (DUF3567)